MVSGIGVVPLAACKAQVGALGLKVVRLDDAWSVRRLLMAQLTTLAGTVDGANR